MTGDPCLTVDPNVRSETLELIGGVPQTEFSKIFDAWYGFEPADLSRVASPTLVMYDEQEAVPLKRQGNGMQHQSAMDTDRRFRMRASWSAKRPPRYSTASVPISSRRTGLELWRDLIIDAPFCE